MSGNGDYISRADAIEAMYKDAEAHPDHTFWTTQHEALLNIPAADVRPVVLCRDCMYAPSGTDDGEDQGFALEWPHDEWPEDNPCPCKCEDGWYSHKPKPGFFCANGKREES